MKDFFAILEIIFVDMWNALYKFLCGLMGEEVNPDWIVDSTTPNVD